MDRRRFMGILLAVPALVVLGSLKGCGQKESPARLGNQEKLWDMATSPTTQEVPLEPGYNKDTPAFFRDASLGRPDAALQPKIVGG